MKRKQKLLKSLFTFLLFGTFSMLAFGCWEDDESKTQNEKVKGKQLMQMNNFNTNEADVVDTEMQLEEWMLLVENIKFTLSEMEERSKPVLQNEK
ncbi:MAG: hypothetical protein SCABRO_02592 [Candidatus Scalindua brodae]|uniref:Lipoprotein n=1 Tax=Candidatus Scalindua brodae TaxID=237368 RepID=A0A0B0EGE8_9BACT|nr:MAG: hypothetical protein SCABRO_02592 [Candidatus Scalindua brodae]